VTKACLIPKSYNLNPKDLKATGTGNCLAFERSRISLEGELKREEDEIGTQN
jgi:hypothetical protein